MHHRRMELDFFGTDADIARARACLADAGAGALQHAAAATELAWFLRQRDTAAALRHADEAEAHLAACAATAQQRAAGRLALVRGETEWLFNRLDNAALHLAAARAAFAAGEDEVGLGDADLLDATLRDQVGGDRSAALRSAHERYQHARHADRERLGATWLACIEATAQPDAAEASWRAALDEAAALHQPGLDTYIEGANGTLAWRRGDPAAAIVCFQRGFDAALASGQRQSAVTLAQNIGIAFSSLNDHEGALAWVDRARAVVEPTGWPYATGWCLMQTGAILLGLGRAQAAKQLLEEGMPVHAGSEGSRNHTLACQILGEACLELGEDAQALRWCALAQQGADRLPFPDLVSGTLRYTALALSRLGRRDDALAAAGRALAVAETQSDWRRVATIHHVLAEIARTHGEAPPAGSPHPSGTVHHLEAALAAGARMAGFAAPAEWHGELSAAYEAAGDLARSLASERLASQARQQAQARRAQDLATAMLVRHQTEQARAEASRQRALAEASRLRAELLETQAALEKERMQSLLVHAGKMVAIGRMASGVVHEMSHPVGTLLLLAEALQERLAAGPAEVSATLATLVGETRRLQQFVGRLRDFARAEPPQLGRHDLRSVLADARQLFAPRLAVERITHVEEVPSLAVDVDPQRLALAVANLVFNAADALEGCAERHIRIHAAPPSGDRIELHVDDSGPGLPEAVRARLFEPFFTTKPEGKGLGLGLALSAESLAAMGGRIEAANRAEGGARFSIVLPVAVDCTRPGTSV
jgi:signal transduction histidine kinase